MQIITHEHDRNTSELSLFQRSYEIMSLLEILRFRAEAFYKLSSCIGQFLSFLHDDKPLSSTAIALLVSSLADLERECRTLQLPTSLKQLVRIKQLIDSPISTNRLLYQNIGELQNRISDELEVQYFIHIPFDKTGFFVNDINDIDEHWVKYFDVDYDFREANKCFALARYTACVFHLMRVLEMGLNKLARQLEVPCDHKNWQNIIDEIEKKIRSVGPTNGPEWKEKERIYSASAVEFRYFKNAWRNHVAHVRNRYDEEEAINILRHVRSFMQHLGANLNG